MNKKVRYLIFAVSSFAALVFAGVLFMAVFRLCPPVESGPQPPWCVNEDRFERDFEIGALTGFMRSSLMRLFPGKRVPESRYDPSTDTVDYFEMPAKKGSYAVAFGVAPSDFYWPVCDAWRSCVNPKKATHSTIGRISSLGSEFVVFTDYARITANKRIYEDSRALSRKDIDEKINAADKYGLVTVVLINLFPDEVSVRHSPGESGLENGRVFGKPHQMIAMDSWSPDEETMHLMFDRWEKIALEKAKKWGAADYIVINPEDMHFHFLTHPEIMNLRNKELIEKTKQVYDGKVCVHFKSLDYLDSFPGLNYYLNADCVVLGGHLDYSGVDYDSGHLQSFFENYFKHRFFENLSGPEIFQMISAMSYDKYLEDGWFEVFDYNALGLEYKPDFKLQATVYESFFRALQNVQPNIKGIFHYGYWWHDENFSGFPGEADFFGVEFMNSIRNKDAEHIFYRWHSVVGGTPDNQEEGE